MGDNSPITYGLVARRVPGIPVVGCCVRGSEAREVKLTATCRKSRSLQPCGRCNPQERNDDADSTKSRTTRSRVLVANICDETKRQKYTPRLHYDRWCSTWSSISFARLIRRTVKLGGKHFQKNLKNYIKTRKLAPVRPKQSFSIRKSLTTYYG